MAAPEGLPEAVQQGLSVTGIGGVVAAVLYGLSQLIRAWRAGPNAGEEAAQNNLADEVTRLATETKSLREEVATMRRELQKVQGQSARFYRQREEARALLAAELIAQGKELREWPPEEGDV